MARLLPHMVIWSVAGPASGRAGGRRQRGRWGCHSLPPDFLPSPPAPSLTHSCNESSYTRGLVSPSAPPPPPPRGPAHGLSLWLCFPVAPPCRPFARDGADMADNEHHLSPFWTSCYRCTPVRRVEGLRGLGGAASPLGRAIFPAQRASAASWHGRGGRSRASGWSRHDRQGRALPSLRGVGMSPSLRTCRKRTWVGGGGRELWRGDGRWKDGRCGRPRPRSTP